MRLVVFGAGGGVGRELVTQALARGHEVTAFVHERSNALPAGARQIEGDVLDAAAVRSAIAGQEAVADAIGSHTPWRSTELEPDAARNIVRAMRAEGLRRLIVTSAMGVGDSAEVIPPLWGYLIMPTFLRGTIKDYAKMEAELANAAADLEWVVVRPAALTDDAAIGSVKVYEPGGDRAHRIARADVAAFMLDQLVSDSYVRRAVNIATM